MLMKPKVQIGAAGARISYTASQRAFHHSDVPEAAREKKVEVERWRRPDILGLRKPDWNASASTDERLCVRKGRQLSKGERDVFQYNYRAEVLPVKEAPFVPKPTKFQSLARTAELPVHPSLEAKPEWNVTSAPDPHLRRQFAHASETARILNSTLKSASMQRYTPPAERTALMTQRIREEKARARARVAEEAAAQRAAEA